MTLFVRLWFFALVLTLSSNAMAQQPVRIGVLAFQDKAATLSQWQPTAQYLTQQIPGHSFEVVALTYDELDSAVALGSVHFVLTNPEHYVVLRARHLLRPLATLNRRIGGQVVDKFGSVIFTRADTGIQELRDVRGKRVAAVGLQSLGGFLMAADTLAQQGVKLQSARHVAVHFTGVPHSLVVQQVVQGQADVGIVRTGVLEQMQSKGEVDLRQLRVLNRQPPTLFPQLLSTDLYPEWPWAALAHTPDDLGKAVTLALLQIAGDAEAARLGGYQCFATPANYTPVEELMHRLKVYPGMQERPLWLALWQDKQQEIMLLTLLGLTLSGGVISLLWRNNVRLRELTRLNQEAQRSLELTAAAFDSEVGLIVTDELTRIRRANRAMSAMLGYTPDELLGQPTAMLRGASVAKGTLGAIWKEVQTHGRWQGELMCRHSDGHDVPCMVTIAQAHSEAIGLAGFVGSFSDITQQKTAEDNIRQLAYFDQLTHLPNRRKFLEELQVAMDTSSRQGTLAAVMFIDLDHFKNLNDTHGHSVGDQLLLLIAQRLGLLMAPSDMVARLGGDEFVVMLTNLDTREEQALSQAMEVAQTMHQTLLSPFNLDTTHDLSAPAQTLRYTCSGSIGVALFGLVDEPLTEVLKRADVAMYRAKQDGRNLIRPFDPAAQQALRQRMALSNDLNQALADNQLHLLYQLQVDASNAAVGAECLLRWQHPMRGAISPVEFIPLAEDSGAIIAMGDWVVLSACQTLVRWSKAPALRHLTLSVNVSPRQFLESDFVARVTRILADTGAQAHLLRLEVTEGIVLNDTQLVIDKMREFCDLGLSFSLDDFGTGYSSLSYIQKLPLAELKIDKSFVNDVTSNARSEAIVKTIVALGQSMAITIVCEGVETQEQKEHLLALGCTLLQGYLITRPTDRDALETLVQQHHGARLVSTPLESAAKLGSAASKKREGRNDLA